MSVEKIHQIYLYTTDRKYWKSIPNRRFHILSYQMEGEYEHRFSSGTLSIKKDTLFLLNRESDYTVRCISGGSSVCIGFTGDVEFGTAAFDCADYPHIRNLFSRILTLKNLNIAKNRYRAFAILYELLAFIEEQTENTKAENGTRHIVEELHRQLTERYGETAFNVYEAAEKAGLGARNFRNVFKKLYGTTPTQYLIDLRLRSAAGLLSDGGLSISDIAEMTGFSDVYYFSKLFRKRFSLSPGKFRKNASGCDALSQINS